MKKFNRSLIFAAALLAAPALLAPLVPAQSAGADQSTQANSQTGRRGHGGHRKHRRAGTTRLMKQLNLTEDQQARIKQVKQSHRERTQSLRQEVQAKLQEVRQASTGGVFNEALATQKLTEMAGLRAKLMGARFTMRQQMLAVLTPEQKIQLEQTRAQFKAKRIERRASQSR